MSLQYSSNKRSHLSVACSVFFVFLLRNEACRNRTQVLCLYSTRRISGAICQLPALCFCFSAQKRGCRWRRRTVSQIGCRQSSPILGRPLSRRDSHGACEVDLADASRVHIRFRDSVLDQLLFGVLQQVSSDCLAERLAIFPSTMTR